MQATKKQYKHCLVITDAFSKFVWIYPVKTTSAEEVVNKLILQESVFGSPVRMITDRGSAFRSDLFKKFCEEKNIETVLTTTGVARSNGQVERQNQIIKSALIKMSMEKPDEWFKHCAKLQKAMNSSYQRAIGMSPFEVMIGIPMKTELLPEIKEILEKEQLAILNDNRLEVREVARANIQKIQTEAKRTFNKTRKNATMYAIDDLVAIKRTQFLPGLKLHSLYLGPYRVTKIKRNERYDVEKIGSHEGPNKTSSSAEFMKPWSQGEICYSDDSE